MTITARHLLDRMSGERTARENARLTWLMTSTDLPHVAPTDLPHVAPGAFGGFDDIPTAPNSRSIEVSAEAASENWATTRRSAVSAP